MSEFTITMCLAPGVSEAERRRRLHQAYSIILEAVRKNDTDAAGQIDGQDPDAPSGDTAQKRDMQASGFVDYATSRDWN